MTWFSIQAKDVWLFRDGKPFTAGEDNSARSMFPPTPLTVQGALRQKISVSNGLSFADYRASKSDDVNAMIGSYEAQKTELDTGNFKMGGPFLGVRSAEDTIQPLFPCPADLLFHNSGEETQSGEDFLITNPVTNVISHDLSYATEQTISHEDLNDLRLLQVYEDYENLPQYWMTAKAFSQYLDGLPPDVKVIPDYRDYLRVSEYINRGQQILPADALYQMENRFGVSTDSATSFREEGMLYQAQFVRPDQDVVLLADVSGTHEDEHVKGQITLGGEQRLAMNESVEVEYFPTSPETISGQFKIVFLTPAYFRKGWLPDVKWSSLFGGEVSLVSAALYRPLKIGGWNSAGGKNESGAPRAMHHYVAPGSVYYFKTNATIVNPPKILTENPDKIKDAAQIGFGQIAYSTW